MCVCVCVCFVSRLPPLSQRLYMNINSSYKFWKDVKIGFLHMFDDSPFYLIALIIFGNLFLNGPPYLLSKAILSLF